MLHSTTEYVQAGLFMDEGMHLYYDLWLNDSEDGIHSRVYEACLRRKGLPCPVYHS